LGQGALELLTNPTRARTLSDAARAWATETFSATSHAAAVAGIYRELLGAR
jgi:hypothetical protein